MYRILVVEDDATISSAVCKRLDSWGWETRSVKNLRDVMHEFIQYQPQLVIMDISLPFYNGYHWCSEIRKISKVPIIFLSSYSDNMNVVMAVNMGADDFIAKPFDLDVLTAKISAVLRRTYDFSSSTAGIVEANGAVLNTGDAALYYNGERIDLSKNEYRILQVLMENKGKIISRDNLMARLWETDSFIDDNTLTVNVTRLRRRLSDAGLCNLIKTKKGLGYIIE